VHPAHFFGEAGPSSVHLSVSVPSPGDQTYQVTVRDTTNGLPRPDVQKVFLTFVPPPASDLPPERVELEPGEIAGLFSVGGAHTPVVGEWGLEVAVRRAGALDESAAFAMGVVEPSPPLAGPPPDTGIGVPAPLAALWSVLPSGAAGWIPGVLAVAAFLAVGLTRAREGVLRGLLLASAAVLLLGVGSRSVVEAANEPTQSELAQFEEPAAGSPDAGARIYLANCASCHGVDGEGGGAVPLLARPALLADRLPAMSDAEVSYRIANGLAGTPMPAFASSLTEQERRDLVSYLRQRWGAP
jgi:mono/diheme cytochrome c family protein